jgi:hypothetical protein
VPAESARLTRRLRPRDWWFLGLVSVALAAGVVAAAIYVAGSKEKVKPGCIATIRAGIMGGQTYSVCGSKALAFCRLHAGDSTALTAECARVVALFGS